MLRLLVMAGWAWVLVARVTASPSQLIRPDDPWRYSVLAEQGPAVDWEKEGFDDSGWGWGPGGFSVGFSGYLQGATVIPFSNGRAYVRGLALRRPFVVENVDDVRSLLLRAEYEDGLLVWLNGVEVARRGLPAGPVPRWDTVAASHPLGEAEVIDLSDARGLLRAGTNWLALQVFDGSTFGGTVYLWPELRANFARGPLVQNVSSNRMTVIWRCGTPTSARIELRPNGQSEWRHMARVPAAVDQAVELGDLAPGERYDYRVILETPGREIVSDAATVRLLRASGDVDFIAVGDTGASSLGQYAVAAELFAEPTDLVLHLGDIAYPSFTRGRVDLRCLTEYEPSMRSVPWFFTMGNHDVYSGVEPYLESFRLPRNVLNGSSLYYSFDHGDVHFVSLFVPWWGMSSIGTLGLDGSRSAQYLWLTNDLATTTKPWKIVFFHQPPLTSGPHALDDYDANGELDTVQMKNELVPLLSQYGVQLVLNGHDHNWERFAPTNGTHFVVSGGGGAFLYTRTVAEVASAQFMTRYHFLRVQVRGPELTAEAVGAEGQVFDRFTLRTAEPTAPVLHAPWVERLPNAGMSNADGNVVGEVFDLPGLGLASVSGRAANLGRLVAGVDSLGVRLGLREVMIWPGQTVALFVGGAKSGGVDELSGVGGASGSGLGTARLRFSGDRASLVALLGDEFGDGQRPEWVRPGTSAIVGQGVFRLDAELTGVERSGLRQFNRSPEGEGVGLEQNSDFAVVSIPWGALDGVWPGGRISVWAVALSPAGPEGTLPLALDSAYLGTGWSRTEDGGVTLGGVTVVLDSEPGGPPEGDRPELSAVWEAGRFRMSWRTRIGRSYEVERAEHLPGPFLPVGLPGFPRPAVGPREMVVVPGEGGQGWYRVRSLP